jgi:hypothetical protein
MPVRSAKSTSNCSRHSAQLGFEPNSASKKSWQSTVSAPAMQAVAASVRSKPWHAPGAVSGGGVVVPAGHDGKGAGQVMSQTTGNVSSSHVSPSDAQLTQVAPPDPHAVVVVPARQLFMASQHPAQVSKHGHAPPPPPPSPVWQLPLPSQHPSGHVVGPHTNPPHDPSRQKPVGGQLTHCVPSNPQSAFVVPGWQVLEASQQPKQFSGLHGVVTHEPLSQSWSKLHSAQALPPLPQSKVWLPGWHSPLESQQPVGHVVLLHFEPWQKPSGHEAPLPLHVAQVLPPLPQSDVVFPGWQMSCWSQHPLGHVWKVHVAPWQLPPTHASPEGHAAQALPPVPQSFRVIPSWHTPETSQQPVGQVVGLHAEAVHDPAVQASLGGHEAQALPPVPQNIVLVPGSQTPEALQHPVGHVDGLQVGG